jgi:hypothetical protein
MKLSFLVQDLGVMDRVLRSAFPLSADEGDPELVKDARAARELLRLKLSRWISDQGGIMIVLNTVNNTCEVLPVGSLC